MRIDVKECARLLLEQDDILILTHAHPDGDTLGCGFALCRALQSLGKTVRVLCGDPIPERYEYMFSDLPQHELDKLCTVDRYPSDSFVFSSHGYDLHIDNELVADAFANLPQQEQSILILYCVLDMADGEIASLTGMSRSAVQRHRTKTLKELRVKLMALMPEGG